MAAFGKSTFSHATYAALRPSYPDSLYSTILDYHQGPKNVGIDLGCGHGVVSRGLSRHLGRVIGIDPSEGMIKQARSSTPESEYSNTEYRVTWAEDLSFLADGSVDCVVAGQAAHWFNHTKLFPELERVLRSGGMLAFWGYKDPTFVDYPEATKTLHNWADRVGEGKLGAYWQFPGRRIVEDYLKPIKPPTENWEDVVRVEYHPGVKGAGSGSGTCYLMKRLKIGECKEYVRTWSAYHNWEVEHPGNKKRNEGGEGDIVDWLFDKLAGDGLGADEEKMVELEWGTGLLIARRK